MATYLHAISKKKRTVDNISHQSMYASGANPRRYVHNMALEPMLGHVVGTPQAATAFCRYVLSAVCSKDAKNPPRIPNLESEISLHKFSSTSRTPPSARDFHTPPPRSWIRVRPAGAHSRSGTYLAFFSFTFSCYYCQFQRLWHRLIDEASVQLCGRRTQSSRTCLAAIKQISSRGCSSCAAHNMPLFRPAACVQTDGPLHQGQKVKHSSSCQERAYYYYIFPIRRPRAHSTTNMLKVIPDLHYHFPRA